MQPSYSLPLVLSTVLVADWGASRKCTSASTSSSDSWSWGMPVVGPFGPAHAGEMNAEGWSIDCAR